MGAINGILMGVYAVVIITDPEINVSFDFLAVY